MTYYLAPALVKLRDEVNARWPGRSKVSDGWIGDTSHQARPSDHNPDYDDGGIVRAIDVTNDGIDREAFIADVIGDVRTAYVISMGRIWQNPAVYKNGGWLKYTGASPHDHHVHVSVRHGSFENDQAEWFTTVSVVTSVVEGDWLDMATLDEVRAVVADEIKKAQGRGAGGLIAYTRLGTSGVDGESDTYYVLDSSTMTRRHLGPNALARARAIGVPELSGRQSSDFVKGFTLVGV